MTDVVGQLYPAVSFQAWTGGGAKVRIVDYNPKVMEENERISDTEDEQALAEAEQMLFLLHE